MGPGAAAGLPGPTAADGTLHPFGLDPIEGVVDYVGPEFLGVRAPDGLYRFHGLGRMGMPIAVGHHVFGADVDRERLDRDWASWTERRYAS